MRGTGSSDESGAEVFPAVAIGAFFLNLAWEMIQAFLFLPHFSGLTDFMAVHVVAAFTDVVITSVILFPEIFLFGDLFDKKWKWRRIVATAILGFVIAVMIERYALSTGMWAYGPYMPIIPFFGVGLSPILQMVGIPLISFHVFGKCRMKAVFLRRREMSQSIDRH
ncbi:MAG: hypothetical protein HGA31_06280 [Candidatus Moranbacteria bacterium]|nr:hypothetical protein [Candidatus Moranbacteria bacterium]